MARIILLEHDRPVGDDIEAHLTAAGHEVTRIENGKAGAEVVEATSPDVVLADVDAPGEHELVSAVASDGIESASVDLILISPSTAKQTVIEEIKSGADDYVTRPIDFGILQAKIDAFTRKRQAAFEAFREEGARERVLQFGIYVVVLIGLVGTLGMLTLLALYGLKSGLGIDLFKDVHLGDLLG